MELIVADSDSNFFLHYWHLKRDINLQHARYYLIQLDKSMEILILMKRQISLWIRTKRTACSIVLIQSTIGWEVSGAVKVYELSARVPSSSPSISRDQLR